MPCATYGCTATWHATHASGRDRWLHTRHRYLYYSNKYEHKNYHPHHIGRNMVGIYCKQCITPHATQLEASPHATPRNEGGILELELADKP